MQVLKFQLASEELKVHCLCFRLTYIEAEQCTTGLGIFTVESSEWQGAWSINIMQILNYLNNKDIARIDSHPVSKVQIWNTLLGYVMHDVFLLTIALN